MPDWQHALEKKVNTSELREQYIHAHGVLLQAMGQIGADLLATPEATWKRKLKKLKNIDWSRANKNWEGRAMVHGRISKATTNVILTGSFIKKQLELNLNPIEAEEEKKLRHGK
jgi:DNA sulfur modification protein DndB